MLLLLPLPFLAVGCICFLICAAIPVARRFALTLSLWFVAWGAIITGLVIVLLLIFMGTAFVTEQMHSQGLGAFAGGVSAHIAVIGTTVLLLITAAGATGVAFLHGAIIRRITFFLFRIYLTAVAFGVGLLSADPIAFAIVNRTNLSTGATFALALAIIPLLAALLAWFCYLHAQDFRALRPETLNPISQAEYGAP